MPHVRLESTTDRLLFSYAFDKVAQEMGHGLETLPGKTGVLYSEQLAWDFLDEKDGKAMPALYWMAQQKRKRKRPLSKEEQFSLEEVGLIGDSLYFGLTFLPEVTLTAVDPKIDFRDDEWVDSVTARIMSIIKATYSSAPDNEKKYQRELIARRPATYVQCMMLAAHKLVEESEAIRAVLAQREQDILFDVQNIRWSDIFH